MGELKKILNPGTIAFIGADDDERSPQRITLENLLKSEGRKIFPVNPDKEKILDLCCFPGIAAIGRHIDLAVIAAPSGKIPGLVKECAENGVEGALIMSAGPSINTGEAQEFEKMVTDIRRTSGLRVIGPGSSGIFLPNSGLNATCLKMDPIPGGTAFIGQSGTMESAMFYWGIDNHIGFSMFASLGSMIDVDFADLIDFLQEDYFTKSIMLYLEHVKDTRRFLSAAREFSRNKPLVVLKPGKYPVSAENLTLLTGCEAGSDMVYDAAFKRAGIVRAKETEDFYDTGRILMSRSLPRGPRLAIVTNSGALGVISCDILEEQSGKLARFSENAAATLKNRFTYMRSINNPLDMSLEATIEDYLGATGICLRDSEVDGVLVIYAPSFGCEPGELGRQLAELGSKIPKTLISVWMGAHYSEEGIHAMRQAGIPVYETPEDAVRAYMYMVAYRRNIELLNETPHEVLGKDKKLSNHLKIILHNAVKENKETLNAKEVSDFLSNYGIPDLKRYDGNEGSSPLTAPAREWAVRSMRDKDFGAVILFLSMDAAVRHKGFAVGLPPLNSVLARHVMDEAGFSSNASAQLAMEDFLVKYSNLIAEFPEISEIEIEAVVMPDDRVYAQNATMLVDSEYKKGTAQYPHLSIMPYPTRYIMQWTMRDGTDVVLRPIRAEDEPLMQEMFSGLSEETLRVRFFVVMQADHRVFAKFCNVDYDREISLVVEMQDNNKKKLIGGGTLIIEPGANAGQFALLIADYFQKQGIGEKLLDVLIGIAQDKGLREIYGIVLSENVKMLGLAEKMGFKPAREPDGITRVSLQLE
ncbi:MAG: bifunctional acetate--CoA ligase family protein/GNAT family N-acetyltransferase [Syntrophorhabdaceae bacterium]